ncbi:MAG: glycerate kinase [Planctomycetota bacterium]|nr:glycerate kinase [Planctomycetota bacterium]
MKLLVAPDSFKGTSSATQAANIIVDAVAREFPEVETTALPVADGGEGFIEVLDYVGEFDRISLECADAFGKVRRVPALRDGSEFFISSAFATGTDEPDCFDVLHASSAGVGQMIAQCIQKGAETIYIGLGGSRSVDLGTGMARELGVRFFGSGGFPVEPKGAAWLSAIFDVDPQPSRDAVSGVRIVGLCDVLVPLNGAQGGIALFSSQKGADAILVRNLMEESVRLSRLFEKATSVRAHMRAGSGSAGGLGAGLAWFTGAELVGGFSWYAGRTALEQKVLESDLVLTGEGTYDRTSTTGKAADSLVKTCLLNRVTAAIITGTSLCEPPGGVEVFELRYSEGQDSAKPDDAADALERAAIEVVTKHLK